MRPSAELSPEERLRLPTEPISEEERNWLRYLKALEAENWAAAAILHERLADAKSERLEWVNSTVAALRTLAGQIVEAAKADHAWLAETKTKQAVRFLPRGDGERSQDGRATFFTRLGERFATEGVTRAQAGPVLAALPDDAARETVVGAVIAAILARLENAENVAGIVAILEEAKSWGMETETAVFARATTRSLRLVYREAIESNHSAATQLTQTISAELLHRVQSAETGIDKDRDSLAAALNTVAWHMASCSNPKQRNGSEAVKFATAAIELTPEDHETRHKYLNTLAAAHAEAGQFPQAIQRQTEALNLAPDDQKADFQSRLDLYRNNEAYWEGGKPVEAEETGNGGREEMSGDSK